MNPRIESLEKMLDGPRDGSLLRFSLGNEYLKAGDPAKAAAAFQAAVGVKELPRGALVEADAVLVLG